MYVLIFEYIRVFLKYIYALAYINLITFVIWSKILVFNKFQF